MSDIAGGGRRSSKANIEILFDELMLATQWERPSLLLTVHRARAGLQKARHALEQKLREAGQEVVSIEPDREHDDVTGLIAQTQRAGSAIFFISNLEYAGSTGGGEIYQGLNLHREFFVENKVRAVFWLTGTEASSLPHLAPDFWAFRHRVLEFASPAIHLSHRMLSRLLMWHDRQSPAPPRERREQIKNNESLLAGLPQNPESLAMRIDLHTLLGHSWWAAGEPEKALQHLKAGVQLAEPNVFADLKARLRNGIAIIRHEAGQAAEAARILQELLSERPEDSILLMNMGITSCSLGRNSEGISQSSKAAAREPGHAALWDRLGHLYLALAKFDEASASFEKAIAASPREAAYHESMAACLSIMGLPEEALAEIKRASELEDETYARDEICRQAILGDSDRALELLQTAVQAGQVSRDDVSRDLNVTLLMDLALSSKST